MQPATSETPFRRFSLFCLCLGMPIPSSVSRADYTKHLKDCYDVDTVIADARYDFSTKSGIGAWRTFKCLLSYLLTVGSLGVTGYLWYHGTPWCFLPSVYFTLTFSVSLICTVLLLPSKVAIFRAHKHWFPITLTTVIALCLTSFGCLVWLAAFVWAFTDGFPLPLKAFAYAIGGRLLGVIFAIGSIAALYGMACWIYP